ncbi:MAG: VOC family protein [Anaerolineae bacterium]|nr:VOC family protein [Anaerolineae bacterium]
MQIEHIALWTNDIERLKQFYETWFGAQAGERYVNETKRFTSYFLCFAGGARVELMMKAGVGGAAAPPTLGYAHLALSTGSAAAVNTLTEQLRQAGIPIIDGPRWTGDGYYEAVILDPDGNQIEITI